MKTYKVFEKDEMNEILKKGNAEVTDFYEYLNDFCNDVAIHWYVEKITDEQIAEEEADPDSVCWMLKGRKIINDYLLSIGCKEDELVYVDITW